MNYNEVLANARENIGKLCKACPVCNGLACRNTVPGPGAIRPFAITRSGRRSE